MSDPSIFRRSFIFYIFNCIILLVCVVIKYRSPSLWNWLKSYIKPSPLSLKNRALYPSYAFIYLVLLLLCIINLSFNLSKKQGTKKNGRWYFLSLLDFSFDCQLFFFWVKRRRQERDLNMTSPRETSQFCFCYCALCGRSPLNHIQHFDKFCGFIFSSRHPILGLPRGVLCCHGKVSSFTNLSPDLNGFLFGIKLSV